MVNADGDFVIAKPDKAAWELYQEKAKASAAAAAEAAAAEESKALQARGLECPIDKRMFLEPTKTPCCQRTYCNDCISNALIESDFVCPGCSTEGVLLDNLVPDDEAVSKIKTYETEKAEAKKEKEKQSAAAQEEANANANANAQNNETHSSDSKDPAAATSTPQTSTPDPSTQSKKRPAETDLTPDNANGNGKKARSESLPDPSSTDGNDAKGSPGPNANANANSNSNKNGPTSNAIPPFNPAMPFGPGMMPPFSDAGFGPGNMNFMNPMGMPNFANGMGGWNNMPNMPFQNGYDMSQNGFPMFNGDPSMMFPMGQGGPLPGAAPAGMPMGNGFPGLNMNNFSNQQRTTFGGPGPYSHNGEDSAYFRQPVNPQRHQARNRRVRPSDYREL